MKDRKLAGMKANVAIVLVCIALSGSSGVLATRARAQTPSNAQAAPVSLPPGMVDVIGLTKAGFGEDGILAKVKKAGVSYDLTTEQMIYLKNQGVSENVISTLLQAGPATTPPPPVNTAPVTPPPPSAVTSEPPSTPAPASTSSGPPEAGDATTTAPPPGEPVVNADYVQDQLSPYGSWVDVPEYGRCWQPSELPNGWRPYYDGGHWVYTDAGLYWQSDYPWGAVAFHYGRWTWAGDYYRWIWVPGYEYAPAWVFWRHADADGHLGWAPLPYGAVWANGGWWEYRGARFGVDYDFGFGPGFFVFVGYDHLWEPDYHRFVLHGAEFHRIFARSEISRLRRDEHGRFVREGLDREHLEHLTGRKVDVVRQEKVRQGEREAMRNHYTEAVEKSRSRQPVARQGEPKQGEPRQAEPRQGEPKQGEPRQAEPRQGESKQGEPRQAEPRQGEPKQGEPRQAEPRQGEPKQGEPKQGKPGNEDDKGGDKKNPNQSKGNTNQHLAQLKGSAGA